MGVWQSMAWMRLAGFGEDRFKVLRIKSGLHNLRTLERCLCDKRWKRVSAELDFQEGAVLARCSRGGFTFLTLHHTRKILFSSSCFFRDRVVHPLSIFINPLRCMESAPGWTWAKTAGPWSSEKCPAAQGRRLSRRICPVTAGGTDPPRMILGLLRATLTRWGTAARTADHYTPMFTLDTITTRWPLPRTSRCLRI